MMAGMPTELAVAAADRRELLQPVYSRDNTLRTMGGDLPPRLGKAAEKAQNEAKKTFFGIKRPSGLLDDRLR